MASLGVRVSTGGGSLHHHVCVIIDSHSHVYPPEVARLISSNYQLGVAGVPTSPAATAPLEEHPSPPPRPRLTEHPQLVELPRVGTLDDTTASMARTGIERAWMLPVATKPKRVRETNDWVLATCAANPQFTPFATIHARDPQWREELDRVIAAGARGVKLHVQLQLQEGSKHLLSDEMMAVFEALERADVLMITCTFFADEIGTGRPGASLRLLDVLAAFPRLRMIAAHMGAMFNWDGGAEPIFGSRAYLDLAYVPGLIEPNRLVEMIRQHGAEKILFGTDIPYADPQYILDTFMDLPLNNDEREAILWRNATTALKTG